MSLAKEIHKFFRGDVDASDEVLEEYSRDASLFRIKPEVVVFPKDMDDVCNLVAFVAAKKKEGCAISLTARSAGTDMTGGPLSESIVVVFTRYMNNLKEIVGDHAVVEPGMLYRDLDAETKKRGLILPSYPASRELCAVGGMVANNAGGEKNLKYGKTERYVEKVTMVLHDGKPHVFSALSERELEKKKGEVGVEGELYRKMYELIAAHYAVISKARPTVSKNSSGYNLWNVYDKDRGIFDLSKVIVGSQGTLGIITDSTLRLVRPNPFSSLVVMFLKEKDVSRLGEIIPRVLSYSPESFESYDDNTFRIAVKFFPEFAARLQSNFFKLAFSFLPEIWMVITGGVPKLVLLAEFTAGTPEEALRHAREAEQALRTMFGIATKIAKTNTEAEKYWAMRRESFNLLRKRIRGLRTAPFIDDLVVAPEHLSEFLPKLETILRKHTNMIYTVAGHMGDGNFHIIPLMDPNDPSLANTIRKVAGRVYDLVLAYNGSISGEHNDGIVRGPYVRQMFGDEVYKLFQETEHIFDPDDIFNPGKKVGVTLDESLEHLDVNTTD
ncbi:MAG: putative oxidoreductase [Parcubacteria group bacterium Gr01-1014_29]|nr:MAG: putative oxidoreductase [Parcubacteria group bacterium Gr01-1014_29]